MRSVFLLAAFVLIALCQEFEVVSIRPSKRESNGSLSNSDPLQFTAKNNTLKRLIMRAYGVNEYQVTGADWINNERFDVAAKYPEALPKDPHQAALKLQAMLQKMLQDRFKLAIHHEQKTFPVYGLNVAKSGIKFKPALNCDSHNWKSDKAHYQATCISMDTFAAFLAGRPDLPENLPVLDMTGLKGFYDLKLEWTPESLYGPAETDPSGPTLRSALQEQLGLKLETRKAPVDLIVVDHAEKLPTEN